MAPRPALSRAGTACRPTCAAAWAAGASHLQVVVGANVGKGRVSWQRHAALCGAERVAGQLLPLLQAGAEDQQELALLLRRPIGATRLSGCGVRAGAVAGKRSSARTCAGRCARELSQRIGLSRAYAAAQSCAAARPVSAGATSRTAAHTGAHRRAASMLPSSGATATCLSLRASSAPPPAASPGVGPPPNGVCREAPHCGGAVVSTAWRSQTASPPRGLRQLWELTRCWQLRMVNTPQHSARALRLYRHSLKHLMSWAIRRDVFAGEVRGERL